MRVIGRLLVPLGCAAASLLVAALPAILRDHVYGDALGLVFLLAAPAGGVAGGLLVGRRSSGWARAGWVLAGLAIGLVVMLAGLVWIALAIESTTGVYPG